MKLFDCRKVTKDFFAVERGYQPQNSIFCILEGAFSFTVNGESVTAERGNVVFFPDDVYFERKILAPMTFYYARFSRSGNDLQKNEILIAEYGERVLEDFVMMERLSRLPPMRTELADHYLADVFVSLHSEKLYGGGKNDPVVERTVEFFRKNLGSAVTLADAARFSGVSQSLLSAKFRTHMGCSPIACLNAMRIERAKELLADRELPISEIGALCGFENPYYFSNAFLKQTGVRPKEYRRQVRI